MRTLKRILGVLLIFFFGVFIGAAVTGAGAMQKLRETLAGGPEAVMDVVVKRLDRELKLDEEQKRKLQGIVDDARIKLRQSHEQIRPQVESTLHEAEDRTRAILYPAQVKKFDDIIARSRAKWKGLETTMATPTPTEATLPTTTPAPASSTPAATPAPLPPSPADGTK